MAWEPLKSGARGSAEGVTVTSWLSWIESDTASRWIWVAVISTGLLLAKPCPRIVLSFTPSFGYEVESLCGIAFLNANLRFGAEAVRMSCSFSLKFLIA